MDGANAEKTTLCCGCSRPQPTARHTYAGRNDPAFRNITFDQLVAAYRESLKRWWKVARDLILIEAVFDTLNAKAAVFAVKEV